MIPDLPLPAHVRERLELMSDRDLAERLDRLAANNPPEQRTRAMREALEFGASLQRERMMPVTARVREAEDMLPRLSDAMRRMIADTWPVEGIADTHGLPHQHVHVTAHRQTREALQRRGLAERRCLYSGKNHAYRLTPLGRAVRMVLRRNAQARQESA